MKESNNLQNRVHLLLDDKTLKDLKAEADKLAMGKSTYIRYILKQKFQDGRSEK